MFLGMYVLNTNLTNWIKDHVQEFLDDWTFSTAFCFLSNVFISVLVVLTSWAMNYEDPTFGTTISNLDYMRMLWLLLGINTLCMDDNTHVGHLYGIILLDTLISFIYMGTTIWFFY